MGASINWMNSSEKEEDSSHPIELTSRSPDLSPITATKSMTPIEALFLQKAIQENTTPKEQSEIPVPVVTAASCETEPQKQVKIEVPDTWDRQEKGQENREPISKKPKISFVKSVCTLLRDNSIIFSSLRMLLLCIAIMIPGIIFRFVSPETKLDGKYTVFNICISITVFIGGYLVANLLLYGLLHYLNHKRLFQNWDFLYYVEELRGFVSGIIWIIVAFILWNSFESEQFAPIKIFVDKILLILLVLLVLFAIKRHLIKSLAMSFNFTNYMERIEENLTME